MKITSGNVFLDLGFSAAEAEDLRLRSDLMIRVKDLIRAKGRPQREIAQLLGVSQPRVSDLLRGKITLFSLESLIAFARQLGAEVEIKVSDAAQFQGPSQQVGAAWTVPWVYPSLKLGPAATCSPRRFAA